MPPAHPLLSNGARRSSRRSGRSALIACIVGVLALAALSAVDYSGPIDYVHAAPFRDVLHAYARHDTRYLAVKSAHPTVTLPSGVGLPTDEPLEIGRDIRLVDPPAATTSDLERQADYIAKYNAHMLALVRGNSPGPPHRLRPISRPLLALIIAAALLPMMLHLYIRYRLAPYRFDGKPWTVSLTSEFYTYLRFGTYAREAQSLVILLWVTLAACLPWALLIVYPLRDVPIG
jgi:hypothetical protein